MMSSTEVAAYEWRSNTCCAARNRRSRVSSFCSCCSFVRPLGRARARRVRASSAARDVSSSYLRTGFMVSRLSQDQQPLCTLGVSQTNSERALASCAESHLRFSKLPLTMRYNGDTQYRIIEGGDGHGLSRQA